RLLAIMELPTKVLGAARLGALKVRGVRWADNDHLLIVHSTTGMPWGLMGADTEWYQLVVYELSSHKLRTYPEPLEHIQTINSIGGEPMVRRVGNDTVLFITGIYVQDQTNLALFKVNLTTHVQNVVRLGSDATQGWLVDAQGDLVAEENY